jgi:NAD(P)-dependent dehydrogenase (short-subunit alcohol dehydrogenase family)
MRALVIGGTSGLGLEIGKGLAGLGYEVLATGRRSVDEKDIRFEKFDLSGEDLPSRIGKFVANLPEINSLVFSAGYFQEGLITDLSDDQIEEMIDVGGRSLIYFVREILIKQKKLDELITITSTSAWTPRRYEPIYNFVKAGEGHFSNSMAEDGRVGKVLVAGPAGMATNFWENSPRDMSTMLDPGWVADQVLNLRKGEYHFRFAKIMREPARVEIVETR